MLSEKTTVMSPEVFLSAGIPCCRCVLCLTCASLVFRAVFLLIILVDMNILLQQVGAKCWRICSYFPWSLSFWFQPWYVNLISIAYQFTLFYLGWFMLKW
jgi:hypothetical protein